MQTKDLYSDAHLFVAAIRVCEHSQSAPPSIDDVCRMISFSLEQGNFICKQLQDMGIVETVDGPYGVRLFVRNHIKIEDIPKGEKGTRLEDELAKFQETQKSFTKNIESFQAKQKEKKESLFSDIEKKLKEELDKKS